VKAYDGWIAQNMNFTSQVSRAQPLKFVWGSKLTPRLESLCNEVFIYCKSRWLL